jgi:hypothetical protein
VEHTRQWVDVNSSFLLGFFGPNVPNFEQNRKKPVETKEMSLTKRLEKLKVKCGTVLRNRMNTDDFAFGKQMRVS